MRRFAAALAVLLAPAAAIAPAQARAQDGAWNSPRALELITIAQARRAQTQADTGMVDYQADARGYIYFYLDRRDTGERSLVKTDQVALDVYWKAPNLAKQRIIGLRDEKSLPTNIRYHEDHLTVVQDNFGDLIRLGDGDEVRDVLHPAAPRGPGFYDYRLADSTSIRLAGMAEPVRVYQLEVRPRDASRSAMVGTIFVDRRGGDIVQMRFTFTRPSYVDRHLDYINVLLENALFKGRFWLPNRQQVEIRRQLPELGLPAGGVIRGTMRITNYRFNQDLPVSLFAGRRVVSVPEAQRRAFAFEQALDEEVREAGLEAPPELADVRRQAAELLRNRVLSGLPTTRVDVATATGSLRYNRAEGLVIAPGVRTSPAEGVTLAARAGMALAPRRPVAEVEVWRGALPRRMGLGVFLNQPRDVGGLAPAASGAMNSLSALLAGYDWTEPYRASGAELRMDRPLSERWTSGVRLGVEAQRSATFESDFTLFGGRGNFRPVRPVDEGTMVAWALDLRRTLPPEVGRGWTLGLRAEGGHLLGGQEDGDDGGGRDLSFVRPRLDAGYVQRWPGGNAMLEVSATAGAALGTLPVQGLYLIGGRGTVPGYPFRLRGGDRVAMARATWSAELMRPFFRGRLTAAAGWTGVGSAGEAALARWGAPTAGQGIYAFGAGLGIFFDILRVDLVRGLSDGGRWELVIEANPSFWDFL
ncbi:MAG TPA: hypothetical protein VFQ45_15895 [Longimicrobium sp.]|nr:hypothetical protein [Longimicrobium sp.]